MTSRDVWNLGKTAADKWNQHNAPRLSAALAYYTLLSLAPVVVLLVLICGLVFARSSAEQYLLDQVRNLAGTQWVDTLRTLIENTQPTKTSVLASIIAILVLFFGATSVFSELRDSLNTIWDAPESKADMKLFLRRRIASIVMVIMFGVLILASTLLDVGLRLMARFFANVAPIGAEFVGETVNILISFLAITALFVLIFKFVPDVPINWKDVTFGAVVTAILFTIGHTLLTVYLMKAAVGSAYGAAGSLVAFVAWIYYCAQIFFFGAVLTRVYATSFGSHMAQQQNGRAESQSA